MCSAGDDEASRTWRSCDLSVFVGDPSAVASDHGNGPSGYLNSFSRQMLCCCDKAFLLSDSVRRLNYGEIALGADIW